MATPVQTETENKLLMASLRKCDYVKIQNVRFNVAGGSRKVCPAEQVFLTVRVNFHPYIVLGFSHPG